MPRTTKMVRVTYRRRSDPNFIYDEQIIATTQDDAISDAVARYMAHNKPAIYGVGVECDIVEAVVIREVPNEE